MARIVVSFKNTKKEQDLHDEIIKSSNNSAYVKDRLFGYKELESDYKKLKEEYDKLKSEVGNPKRIKKVVRTKMVKTKKPIEDNIDNTPMEEPIEKTIESVKENKPPEPRREEVKPRTRKGRGRLNNYDY